VTFDSKVDSLTCNEWKSFCIRNLTRVNIDCARCFFRWKRFTMYLLCALK
jgi:hypothetical protein